MPYWYWRQLKNAWVLNENTTNKFDLPDKGALSALAIQSIAVNAASLAEYDNPYPIQRHTKIRVVGNGNFEIVNASAKQLQAVHCWDWEQDPIGTYTKVSGLFQRNFFYVPFGRNLGDPKYGLDLGRFGAGVEFEETNNYDTAFHTDTSSTLTIFGLFYKDAPADMFSGGFLKKRQINDKDTASEVQYKVKLPTENLLRQIHLFSEPDLSSHLDATSPTTNVQYIWLGIKSSEEYMINNVRSIDFANHIHQIMRRKFRTNVQTNVGTTTAGLGFADTMLYRNFQHAITPIQDTLGNHSAYLKFDDRRICQTWFHASGAADAVGVADVDSFGIMLHGNIPLLMNDPMADETAWLDSKAFGDVNVEITEGASTGNWRVVLDELEKKTG